MVGAPSRFPKQVWLVTAVALFLATMGAQALLSHADVLQGVFAQIQVLVSVGLVMMAGRAGYRMAVALNLLQLMQVSGVVLLSRYFNAIPGILISLTTVALCVLLFRMLTRLQERILESGIQREALEKSAAQLDYQAFHDPLTGLPNRQSITRVLNARCAILDREENPFALVVINLDRFGDINNVLGHGSGDLILRAVAQRLSAVKEGEDFLGRWAADEFMVMIDRNLTSRELYRTAQQYRDQLNEVPYRGQSVIKLSASIGIALYPRDSCNADDLIDYAQTAIRKIREGGGDIRLFTSSMKAEIHRRFSVEQLMMSALEREELRLVFQPQFRIADRSLRGTEALLRWQSPTLGAVDTGFLITLAENNGLIFPWGHWIMQEACRQFAQVEPTLPPGVRLSLNVSPRQMMHRDFLPQLQSLLQTVAMDPQRLELEITESLFITDVETALDKLHRVRSLGVHIAMDDFGTGYSSLNLLRRLPIETLKIDRAFIRDFTRDHGSEQIVEALVNLAHRLEVEVIAEGVETKEQLALLSRCGCDCLQGFLWGMPGPLADGLQPRDTSALPE